MDNSLDSMDPYSKLVFKVAAVRVLCVMNKNHLLPVRKCLVKQQMFWVKLKTKISEELMMQFDDLNTPHGLKTEEFLIYCPRSGK
jgi:hypothetical protein